jgi:hypothetical protein
LSTYNEVVVNSTTALDAWTQLEIFFAGKESFNKVDLLQQLIDGKLIETGNPVKDVQEFIKQKNEIVRRLDSVGMPISKEMQVCIMLARLPESYDTMRRIMESQADLSLIKMTAELNREAIRRSNKRPLVPQEKAFFTGDSRHPKKIKTFHDKKKQICGYCNVSGHDAAACWLNPKSIKFRPEWRRTMLEIASRDDILDG